MTTLTGSDTYFTNIVAATTFTPTQWEACIEQSIDLINACIGEDTLPQMTGTAGSKSVSLTSSEVGWVRTIAVQIYIQDYANKGASNKSVTIGPVSSSQSVSVRLGTTALDMAKEAANKLREVECDLA